MKLSALCCTYLRPAGLGQLIESFLRQNYPEDQRELIILDDAGQYRNQEGRGWRLVSFKRRFNSLGEKRNACAALASPDSQGFLVADDDDIYLPHWFKTQAEALRHGAWSQPSLVLLEHGDHLREADTDGLYHGGWAFRRSAFYQVRGYGPHNNGEDQELAGRLNDAGLKSFDPMALAEPFYIYRYENGSYHLSYMDDVGYRNLQRQEPAGPVELSIGWQRNWDQLLSVRRFAYGASLAPVNGKMPVELIGPVGQAGRDGPTNGMFALQNVLRQRIGEGLNWLSIKSLPVSQGALPWFWNWADRRYANWWNSEGRPFVQGPNMLFINSGCPRIDRDECGLLDAKNCRGMFCHSEWYSEHIAKHRGPANRSPIIQWPYPIDPIPSGPTDAKYDLLIYAKNGTRPQLLEFLERTFKNHVTIHYGRFERGELWEAARQSRACAYLADDDHGPLALQEILLSGCPVVGVRTGAPFIQDGLSGIRVEKMPPAPGHEGDPMDSFHLARYLEALGYAMTLDRAAVCDLAREQFSPLAIADKVIEFLDSVRGAP